MPNYIDTLDNLITRIEATPRDAGCPCTFLTELEPVMPFLRQLREELATEWDTEVSGVVWHTIVIGAAAGYAIGLADAFAGLDALSNVVPLFPERDDDGPRAA